MVAPAPATVDGPAAATGWPDAAVDAPAGSCCGAWGAPGGCCGACCTPGGWSSPLSICCGACLPPVGWLSPLSTCCGTCCGALQPTHALALGASNHGSCDGYVHVQCMLHTVVAWLRDGLGLDLNFMAPARCPAPWA
eukprot:scaffold111741_cov67-Phaeocystis_antarctica.AAC.1